MSFVNKDNITSIIQGSNGVKDALNQKANTDGYYETLTAGTSEQLLSTVSINDKVPYNFRTSGGSADIGNRLTDKIVGGTICWNQFFGDRSGFSPFPAVEEEFTNGVRISSVDKTKGSITIEVNDTVRKSVVTKRFFTGGSAAIPDFSYSTHRWLITGCPKTEGTVVTMGLTSSTTNPRLYDEGNGTVMTYGSGGYNFSAFIFPQCPAGTYVFYPQIIDLTKMFGKTIADYLYNRDSGSSKGTGKAWFRELFPKDYYAYNSGTMMSVNAASHNMVGFNMLNVNSPDIIVGKYLKEDGSIGTTTTIANISEYIRVFPNTKYCFSNLSTSAVGRYCCWYDANKNVISSFMGSSLVVTMSPENAVYLRASYNASLSDVVCINLSWDGEKDGEHESYVKYIYPLDSSLELRGVPLLDSNNKLYYDGDTYESDGTVTRRYELVDLGTLTWASYTVTIDGVSTRIFRSVQVKAAQRTEKALISSRYSIYGGNGASPTNMPDKSIIVGSTYFGVDRQFAVRDSAYAEYTAAQFKEAVSGIYLVYELISTSYTTESADPYTNPQIVDDFGTEEYVDYAYSQGTRDVAIPVGHDTLYMNNLRAKLEMSPDSPDGDGDYIVRQSGGENTYVPLTKELPAAPSEDGNYVLKVTVVDGTPTYLWEAQA